LTAGRDVNPLDYDLLDRDLAPVPVQSIHLRGEQRHQLARQAKVGGAASSGLLDMKRSPTRVHGGHMRDDHLGCEHGFQLVPRANPMKKRQDEICGRGVEGLLGIRVKGIYDLVKERIGDDLLRGPERTDKANAELI
jgi:hypothetical protein